MSGAHYMILFSEGFYFATEQMTTKPDELGNNSFDIILKSNMKTRTKMYLKNTYVGTGIYRPTNDNRRTDQSFEGLV